jgi:hypothetical protein
MSPTMDATALTAALVKAQRELRILKACAVISMLGFGVVVVGAFREPVQQQKFGVIDVERINVVEPGGTLRMVISGRERSQGPLFKGKPFGYPGGTRSGIIFFNDEGTEDGGLTWGGKMENGKYSAVGHLSFDQYNQDQVVTLQYSDENGRRQQGLRIDDRANVPIDEVVDRLSAVRKMPKGAAQDSAMKAAMMYDGVPLSAQRLFAGRDRAKAAVVNLSDPQGKSRLRLTVDSLGAASIEFLDANGAVTRRIGGSDAAH